AAAFHRATHDDKRRPALEDDAAAIDGRLADDVPVDHQPCRARGIDRVAKRRYDADRDDQLTPGDLHALCGRNRVRVNDVASEDYLPSRHIHRILEKSIL